IMFRVFNASTADEVWQLIASEFRRDSVARQESRAGCTMEIMRAGISISDPLQKWIPSRQPAVNVAFALAEVIWIIAGRNDSGFLTFWNRQLPAFAGEGAFFHSAYGYRLRHNLQFDQLDRAYHVLKNDSDNRQVVLQIWDGRIDFPQEN